MPVPLGGEKEVLFQAIRGGSCVAVIGSGPSQPHYPAWPDLVDKLCAACGVAPLSIEAREDAEVFLEKVDECRQANGARYREALVETFGTLPCDIPRIYLQLAAFPFQSYVTTNFDPILRTALTGVPGKCDGLHVYPDLPVQAIGNGHLFHIHGLVASDTEFDLNRIVLGRADFEGAYSDEGSTLRSFLAQLFTYNSCCFIGIKLREPELRRVFRACAAVRGRLQRDRPPLTPPPHYALLPMLFRKTEGLGGLQARDMDGEAAEARTFADLGINVIRYQPINDRHLGLIQLLDECLKLPMVPIRLGIGPESIV